MQVSCLSLHLLLPVPMFQSLSSLCRPVYGFFSAFEVPTWFHAYMPVYGSDCFLYVGSPSLVAFCLLRLSSLLSVFISVCDWFVCYICICLCKLLS